MMDVRTFSACMCADPGCPHHAGVSCCTREAEVTLFRIDMDDFTGTDFCAECGEDAMVSGLYDDAADPGRRRTDMRTRRSWRNQGRLWKAIGQDLTSASLQNKEMKWRRCVAGLVRCLEAHITDESKRTGLIPEVICPCTEDELKQAKQLLAAK